jgi:hypothetical protein
MNRNNDSDTDILDRATGALLEEPIDESPPKAPLVRRTVAAIERADRREPRLRLARVAAVIALAAGAAALLYFTFAHDGGRSIAFAKVLDAVRNARTLSYDVAARAGPLPTDPFGDPVRVMYMEGGRFRTEWRDTVTIRHAADHTVLTLFKASKTAELRRYGPPGEEAIEGAVGKDAIAFIEHLSHLAEGSGKPIEAKSARGDVLHGFEVQTEDGGEYTIWAEPKTARPVRVEGELHGHEFVMGNFVFDAPMDPALFDMKPPDGYTLLTPPLGPAPSEDQIVGRPTEQDVIHFLRGYAQRHDGTFPPRIRWSAVQSMLKVDGTGELSADDLALARAAIGAEAFIKRQRDVEYTPTAGKLGAADAVILRYRPAESPRMRKITGDLNAADEDVR